MPQTRRISNWLLTITLVFSLLIVPGYSHAQGFNGYYQYPTLNAKTIVFTAEGDLWTVPLKGGLASRLTTHHGEETNAVFSPDGKTIAFSATYEGSQELYTMPVTGGLPTRWTFEASSSRATTWTKDGHIVYTTSHYSTLPNLQLVKLNTSTKTKQRIPLNQASEAVFNDTGNTVFFVRPAYHRNVTKRYMGGTARKIWKYTEGVEEAVEISDNYAGESHHPMWWNNRVYFITDRDGIMNIWSTTETGSDYQQHTSHEIFDVRYASQANGKIVYQVGADLWIYDSVEKTNNLIPITLATDLDQRREKWVKDPENYITSINLHPQGEQIVITARGRVFVVSAKGGRFVQLSKKEGVRYRDAIFMPSGDQVLVLTDESGEFEFNTINATGIGPHKSLTSDGEILRYQGFPSPDGKWIAYDDLNSDMWIYNMATKKQRKISTNRQGIGQISWSPDSKWVAFVQTSTNTFSQIQLFRIDRGQHIELTTDRANSTNPVWSPDGQWIYFLSDRNFQSLVGSPWGTRQPEPYFDNKMKIYHTALQAGTRSPFQPEDELFASPKKSEDTNGHVAVAIDPASIQQRIQEVPVRPGNYRGLAVTGKGLYFMSKGTGIGAKTNLMVLKISNKGDKPEVMAEEVRSFELSGDGKKIGIGKGKNYYIADAGTGKLNKLSENKLDLSGWTFSIDPYEDWKQLFTDAWRMERDYFYDPGMHGVDWDAMYEQYLPLIDRITTRQELSDLIGRFVGELSALHTSVRGGDLRSGSDKISIPSLGARFSRDQKAGGFRIDYIYRADPDYPDGISPLARPGLNINPGDVITHVNGVSTLEATDIGELLRNEVSKQVRIGVRSAKSGTNRDIVVVPIGNERSLRYRDWEYSRRLAVDEKSQDQIGYIHLQAMGSRDISQWYREFYPVFNRKGLIIDVRNNNGGNIESFILEKLMRKAWFYWKRRVGEPYGNMQYAFNGHMVVLVNANTASDGEAFAEGFRRLGLGNVIGTRTWGGEIWLGSANRLSDGGLARAPMTGVYGLESEWLIEGHGVVPDIEVDNLPHATFNGQDAQLDTAIQFLLQALEKDPKLVPEPPPYPDKSFKSDGN